MRTDTDNSPLAGHLHAEHENLLPHLDAVLIAAHAVGAVPLPVLRDLTAAVLRFVLREMEPRTALMDRVVYRAVERALAAPGSAETMRIEDARMSGYVQELSEVTGSLTVGRDLPDDLARELRRVLYGLHAVISLHLENEDHCAKVLTDRLGATEQNLVLTDLMAHSTK